MLLRLSGGKLYSTGQQILRYMDGSFFKQQNIELLQTPSLGCSTSERNGGRKLEENG